MEEVERFSVIGEDGHTHTVVVYEDVLDASHMDGRATVRGMRTLELADGRTLTAAGDDEWRVVETWELVRRVR